MKNYSIFNRIHFFWKLKKIFFKKNVLVLGAGPSLEKISFSEIELLQKKYNFCVVALKQAANYYPNYDIAVGNECREVSIKKKSGQYLIGISNPKLLLDWDIILPILTYNKALTLLRKPCAWFWNPLFNPYRPWGVGVFFEIGIFFPIVFRSKLLVTVGFDMTNTAQNPFKHFYGTKTNEVVDNGVIEEINQIPLATASLLKQLENRGIKVISLTVQDAKMAFNKVLDFKSLLNAIKNPEQ